MKKELQPVSVVTEPRYVKVLSKLKESPKKFVMPEKSRTSTRTQHAHCVNLTEVEHAAEQVL